MGYGVVNPRGEAGSTYSIERLSADPGLKIPSDLRKILKEIRKDMTLYSGDWARGCDEPLKNSRHLNGELV